ncbi:SDR family NAD(P)-dependent oxidoreductase [Chitinophaga solisilvae]|uniref:SDR family NAD(P)-dependent oxidoreductase n=1 Tax=Chitinophaga solisilvae TaxID=1233460 RepID=UPI001367F6F1|nr:SDR family NAD(P)-dependent oxidoreductase [Chitinophaga solisilvae]
MNKDVAIIGVSCRFPGAENYEEFWRLLKQGDSGIREIPLSRWDWSKEEKKDAFRDKEKISRWGGFISNVSGFDAAFFNVSAKEAAIMDPQQRIMLELSWACFEDAGIPPSGMSGSRTGVYTGVFNYDYKQLQESTPGYSIQAHYSTGTAVTAIPNRVSWFFNLKGPSLPVDTACASSLHAIHLAVQGICTGECEMALAGGISLMLTPARHISFSRAGMLSSTGSCKAFDDAADGYVRSEGAGVVLLKPLDRALNDGDHIYAVIKGSAVNHGGRVRTLTYPDADAQADVVLSAMRRAGVSADSIGYIEAHGTGTPLGDPVEWEGLCRAFNRAASSGLAQHYCGIGSVKPNIGHLESAAGIAGVVKVLMAMKYRELPGQLNYHTPNHNIAVESSPFYIVEKNLIWKHLQDEAGNEIPLRAGVSSFGFGGTNTHIILEEAPQINRPVAHAFREQLICLSAKTDAALHRKKEALLSWLNEHPDADLHSISATLLAGREHFDIREAFVTESVPQMINTLKSLQAGGVKQTAFDRESMTQREDVTATVTRILQPPAEMTGEEYKQLLQLLADRYLQGARWNTAGLPVAAHDFYAGMSVYPFDKTEYWLKIPPAAVSTDETTVRSPQPATAAVNLRQLLKEYATGLLGSMPSGLPENALLFEYGFDSVRFTALADKLNRTFGLKLSPTLFYSYKTIRELADYLLAGFPHIAAAVTAEQQDSRNGNAAAAIPTGEIKAAVRPSDNTRPAGKQYDDERIAIIGMSGRYPDAPDLHVFWENMAAGKNAVREIAAERWNISRYYQPWPGQYGKTYCKWMGMVDDAHSFDPLFFNITREEASKMDPQQRIALEQAYLAFGDAGYNRSALDGKKCGVYLGVMSGTSVYPTQGEAAFLTGSSNAIYAGRIAYFFNLKGPAITVDTACSSSLTAIHAACQALKMNETSMALAGGVTLYLNPVSYIQMSSAGMLSADGKCKVCDDDANGFVPGEGAGFVVLKRLSDAIADHDHIYGIILGSGINQDGKTQGITAPNMYSQQEVEREVYNRYAIHPESISYVEMHGTGTRLGDPIELNALSAVFRERTDRQQFCAVGSVKSNIGHTTAAAGVAGVHKVLLSMLHGELPPSLHMHRPNRNFDFETSPFFVNTQLRPWIAPDNTPLRAAVSSFGFSGTNAHIVLEKFIPEPQEKMDVPVIIVLSAQHREQLQETAATLKDYLTAHETLTPEDVAFTLQTGRDALQERAGFIADDRNILLEKLTVIATAEIWDEDIYTGKVKLHRSEHLSANEDSIASVKQWITAGQYTRLLEAWVKGEVIDWSLLYHDKDMQPDKVSLSLNPFVKEQMPATTDIPVTEPASIAKYRELHPLLHQNISTLTAQRFSSVFTGEEFFFRDHEIHGRLLLPGVAYLEMIREAVVQSTGAAGNISIKGLTWQQPVTAGGNPEKVLLELHPVRDNEMAFECYSEKAADTLVMYASGTAVIRELPPPAVYDIAALTEKFSHNRYPADKLYQQYREKGFAYGPGMQAVSELFAGEGQILSRLVLPEALQAHLNDFMLHPSLMDAALQTTGAFHLLPDVADWPAPGSALPYLLDEVLIYSSCTPVMWAAARPDPAGTLQGPLFRADVDLCDENGKVCIVLKGFYVKTVAAWTDYPVQEPETTALPASPSSGVEEATVLVRKVLLNLTQELAALLKMSSTDLEPDTYFSDCGLDSILFSAFTNRLNDIWNIGITPAIFYEYRTLLNLADFLAVEYREQFTVLFPDAAAQQETPQTAAILPENREKVAQHKKAQPRFTSMAAVQPAAVSRNGAVAVAVIGMSGRFPQSPDIQTLWEQLLAGKDCITEVPAERWNWRDYTETYGEAMRWGGFIEGIKEFDPLFFNISPEEASYMDPHQRLLMMYAWNAIEDAGYDPRSLAGSKTAVFTAIGSQEYRKMMMDAQVDMKAYFSTGTTPSIGPNRLSYLLDLRGPSEPVETACASSVVAIHKAVTTLADGSCNLALAGGVNILLSPEFAMGLSKGGFISSDGRCKTFSANANGYVRGEGVAVIVLKRLEDAERDGDHIYGVIRGTAENHGGHGNSLTAPGVTALAEVATDAYKRAGIDPRSVGYIEAHGTGTELGDPIEVNALKAAFKNLYADTGAGAATSRHCGLGTVKSNIGHTEMASGMASVIKVLLQLQHKTLVKTLHADPISPFISLNNSPFYIVQQNEEWKQLYDAEGKEIPRRAGINTFGFGGVNAHIVLEEYVAPETAPQPIPEIPNMILLSAETPDVLKEYAGRLREMIDKGYYREADMPRIVYTLLSGRSYMKYRTAFMADNLKDLRKKLQLLEKGEDGAGMYRSGATDNKQLVQLLREEGDREIMLETWMQRRKFDQLLTIWSQGENLPWHKLYPAAHPVRISLPGYPFAKEHCWIPEDNAPAASVTPAAIPADTDSLLARETLCFYPSWEIVPALKSSVVAWEQRLVIACDLEIPADLGQNAGISFVTLRSAEEHPGRKFTDYAWQTLAAIQDLIKAAVGKKILVQVLISHNMVRKGGAGLSGLLKTAEKEQQRLACQLIEIHGHSPEEKLSDILESNSMQPGDKHIRYLGEQRQVRRWNRLDHQTVQELPWKDGGVYLIAGGLNGIGLIFAEEIVNHTKDASLILVARSAPGEQALQKIEQLRRAGASVEYKLTDIGDEAAVTALFEHIRHQYGRLNGILHSAGLLRNNFIVRKTYEELQQVLATKVSGLVNLDRAGSEFNLDIFILFSSIAGAIGNAGQADHAAANAFMDEYALHYTNEQRQEVKYPEPPGQQDLQQIQKMEKLLTELLLLQLHSLQFFKGGQPITVLQANAGWNNLYDRWLKESLHMLTQAGLLQTDGENYMLSGKMPDADALWAAWEQQCAAWENDPGMHARAILVNATLKALPDILCGRKHAVQLMFPDSSMKLVENIYRNNQVADYCNEVIADCVVACLEDHRKNKPGQPLRILEIGAGTGGTSVPVFKKLKPFRDSIGEYCYTDISKAFLLYAEKEYGPEHPYLTCQLFNAEEPAARQAIAGQQYDIVIAANVLHATSDIRQVLKNTSGTLKEGGVLLLCELRSKSVFHLLTFGLLEGWWRYGDPQLRMPGSPGLYPEMWQRVLEVEGYCDVFFPTAAATGLEIQVITARKSSSGKWHPFEDIYRDYFRQLQMFRKTKILSVNWPFWQDGKTAVKEVVLQELYQQWGLMPMDTASGLKAFYQALASKHREVAVMHGVKESILPVFLSAEKASPEVVPEEGRRRVSGKEVIAYFRSFLSKALRLSEDRIGEETPMEKYGISSLMIIELMAQLKQIFGPLPQTLFFEFSNLQELSRYFADNYQEVLAALLSENAGNTDISTPAADDVPQPEIPAGRIPPGRTDIAIIGVGGKYPGAGNIYQLWDNLRNGKDSVTAIPVERWDYQLNFDESKAAAGKAGSKHGGFLQHIDRFDPLFFNISPREAHRIDPQERLFLQCVYEALEDGGYTAEILNRQTHGGKVGVFVGASYMEYQLLALEAALQGNPQPVINIISSIANRVSYYFNFKGPSLALDTMCSSSLTAIHIACNSIYQGDCEVAIAGGVNISVHPYKYNLLGEKGFLALNGKCRSFGIDGDGMVPAEGVGAVLLKPLDRAIADGDNIYGIIKGTAINHGGKTNGYTVPNPVSQQHVILQALHAAGVNPRNISYLEAHGTGTELGDPVEIEGLSRAFRQFTGDKQFCAIGSVKSNIGHCESAAGIAGITKILLQFRHRQLAPTLYADVLNPHIDFENSPFKVQRELAAWERLVVKGNDRTQEIPRCAGISSFGAGGSNAHVILEEYISPVTTDSTGLPVIIVLSARQKEELLQQAERLVLFIATQQLNDDTLPHIAYTLQTGREAMPFRLAFTAETMRNLSDKLRRFISGLSAPDEIFYGEGNTVVSTAKDTLPVRDWLNAREYNQLLKYWTEGHNIDWQPWYAGRNMRRISLPVYPFQGKRYWIAEIQRRQPDAGIPEVKQIDVPENSIASGAAFPVAENKTAFTQQANTNMTTISTQVLLEELAASLCEILYLPATALDPSKNFLEMGLDSILSVEWIEVINAKYGLSLQAIIIYDHPTLREISSLLQKELEKKYNGGVPETASISAPAPAMNVIQPEKPPVITAAYSIARLQQELSASLGEVLYLSEKEINPNETFLNLGVDSVLGLEWITALNQRYGLSLVATVLYDYTNIRELAAYLATVLKGQENVSSAVTPADILPATKATSGLPVIHLTQTSVATAEIVSTPPPVSVTAAFSASRLQQELSDSLGEVLYLPGKDINPNETFLNLGVDSVLGLEWVTVINNQYGLSLTATVLYDYTNIRELADFLEATLNEGKHPAAPVAASQQDMPAYSLPAVTLSDLGVNTISEKNTGGIREQQKPQVSPSSEEATANSIKNIAPDHPDMAPPGTEDIAIIGISAQYPDAPTTQDFWNNLLEGRDCISTVPASRWNIEDYYDPVPGTSGKTTSRWMGAIPDVDKFDPAFFNIPPDEAVRMDPQQRLFLTHCWHSIEDAGINPVSLSGSRCGVYVGCTTGDYISRDVERELTMREWLGNSAALLNVRIAYLLNLQGTGLSVDTACSSSLVAVIEACKSLISGENDLALAGGVTVYSGPSMHIMTAHANLLSPKGRCYSFDQKADGFVLGEGVGVLLLKRMKDALRDGDPVYGVVKGWATNQNGKTNGITAPSMKSQLALEMDVYKKSGINPETITMVEAHGTGTRFGDPIEVDALTTAFRNFTQQQHFCALGTVKSNIGNTLAASGVAGMLKVLLAMKEKVLLPTINFEKLNDYIHLEESPFFISNRLQPWNIQPGMLRRAAVSSFGLNGTNAHLVMEEYAPLRKKIAESNAPVLIVLSARNEARLKVGAEELAAFISGHPELLSAEIAWTLQYGREAMECRAAFVAASRDEIVAALKGIAAGNWSLPGIMTGKVSSWQDAAGQADLEDEAILLRSWIEKGKLDKTGNHWISGKNIEWRLLYGNNLPARVHLPGYPFARESYWLQAAATNGQTKEEISHQTKQEHFPAEKIEVVENKLQQQLKESIAAILAVPAEKTNIDANFRDMGLDSDKALLWVLELNRRYGTDLLVPHVFDCLNIRKLAVLLEERISKLAHESKTGNTVPVSIVEVGDVLHQVKAGRIDIETAHLKILQLTGKYNGSQHI